MPKPNYTPKQKFEALKLIEMNIEEDGPDHIIYKDGFSDAVISEQTGVPAKTISYLRTSMFGKLKPNTNNPIIASVQKLKDRVTELEKRLNRLSMDFEIEEQIKSDGRTAPWHQA